VFVVQALFPQTATVATISLLPTSYLSATLSSLEENPAAIPATWTCLFVTRSLGSINFCVPFRPPPSWQPAALSSPDMRTCRGFTLKATHLSALSLGVHHRHVVSDL